MDALEPNNVLFVYGALTRGMERARFLSNEKARFLCPATANGRLNRVGDFPGLVINPSSSIPVGEGSPLSSVPKLTSGLVSPYENGQRVHGELFEIFDPLTFFDTLDVIEGYWPDQVERSLFMRKLISVETENGTTTAWAYILNLSGNGSSRFDPDE